jgi:hypothetical protein
MDHSDITEHRVQRAEELVCWTGRERLRFLWYRLRLTISEMNYASRRMIELQMGLPPKRTAAPSAASKKALRVWGPQFVNGPLSFPGPAISWPENGGASWG